MHDLLNEGVERFDPSRGRATTQDLTPVNVVCGDVGQRPTASIFKLLTSDPARRWRQGRMAAGQGLKLLFLVSTDHVLVRTQRDSVPDSVIQIQNTSRFERKIWVASITDWT